MPSNPKETAYGRPAVPARDDGWNGLYRVGGLSALLAVAIVGIEAVVAVAWPPPTTVLGWFTLFQTNRVLGLLDHMVLDLVVCALLGPLFLALYVALKDANETWAAVATPFAFLGIGAYWATNTTFSLLYLSDQYAAASTDADRSMFLAAGQAIGAIDQYGMFYTAGFLLVVVASLIVSFVMLRSHVFGKGTSYLGILAGALVLADNLIVALVASTSVVLALPAFVGGFLMFVWWVLVGLRLYHLGREERPAASPIGVVETIRNA